MDGPAWLLLRGVCRGLHLAGYICVFGTALYCAALEPGSRAPGLRRLAWAGFALALAAGMGWFWLESGYILGTGQPGVILAALPRIIAATRFGWLTLARMGLLLAALAGAQTRRWRGAAALSGAGVLAQSGLGHGAAMGGGEGAALFLLALLHIGAAASWLGTLPALALGLRASAQPACLARRYSRFGVICVAVLLLSALAQYGLLIGRARLLLSTAYGATALFKAAQLAGLLGLAGRNRLRLTPALPRSRAALLGSIAGEIALGVLALLAAGVLMQLAPPAMAGMG